MAKPPRKKIRRKKKAVRRAGGKKTRARKPTKKKTRRKSTASRRRLLRRLAGGAAVLALFVGAGLIFYAFLLDKEISAQFETRRWREPARVYAQPKELYAGLPLAAPQLEAHLRQLGYRKVARPDAGGEFRRQGDRIDLVTREFEFWDGYQAPRAIEVDFRAGAVGGLASATGAAVPLWRLDPLAIGSIYALDNEDRILLAPDAIPGALAKAVIAVEDQRFRRHHGVDPVGIARAFWVNLRAGEVRQGGSTITQQLIKSYFLNNQRSWWRKFREAIMAVTIERRYTKDEILHAYLNEVYMGQQGRRAIHGFALASQFYFGREVNALAPHQLALLVGMVRGPSLYDPRRNPESARARRDRVLDLLGAQGVFAADVVTRARAADLDVSRVPVRAGGRHLAFIDLVKRQLRRDYRLEDLATTGLRVFTTLDPALQREAEGVVSARLDDLDGVATPHPKGHKPQAAVVVTAADSAEVLALVGGRSIGLGGFNRALDARRPVGSLLKPFVYLSAFEQGDFHLASRVDDSPISVPVRNKPPWEPRNFEREFRGEISVASALADSVNVPAVRVGLEVGMSAVVDLLGRAGLERDLAAFPSLLLGAVDLTPLEVAQLYTTLANDGYFTPLRVLREVVDAGGRPLRRYPQELDRAVAAVAVHQVRAGLRMVLERGTGKRIKALADLHPALVGKTGSTNDLRDSWFAGFDAEHVVAVWVGFDDNAPLGLTGSRGALPVFASVFAALPVGGDSAPLASGLTQAWVDYPSGALAAEHCGDAVLLPLPAGTEFDLVLECAGAQDQAGDNLLRKARRWARRVFGD